MENIQYSSSYKQIKSILYTDQVWMHRWYHYFPKYQRTSSIASIALLQTPGLYIGWIQ